MHECEFVIIDNNPDSPQAKMGKDLVTGWVSGDVESARWIPAGEVTGTSAPRDRVFREANGSAVLCMDCHVLIVPGALKRLIEYYDNHPDTRDLLSGPLLYDNLKGLATQFDDVWRAEMWGIWGFDKRGEDVNAEPFEIPAMGLGVFSCRKDAWLGFNPRFRGFGGEEFYIHEKFRQAGAKCLCLPFLRWVHRFGFPGSGRYPLLRENKVWNYIVGHLELGLPLDRLKKHFLEVGMKEHIWNKLEEAARSEDGVPVMGCGGCKSSKTTLEELYQYAVKTPSDINFHCEKLRELASQCDHVVEFGKRLEVSTVAILAGQPKRFTSYFSENHRMFEILKTRRGATDFKNYVGDSLTSTIEPADMLFIDTHHNAKQLTAELALHASKISRWIALHDTQIHAEVGDDGSPGLLVGLRKFMLDNPEWSVVYHTQENNGFTVISRDPRDKKPLPSTVEMISHFSKAFLDHVIDGFKSVTHPQLKDRLIICTLCDQRTDNRCAVCGCFVEEKAGWKSEDCPLGKWPIIDELH
jgi:hypothetical protein